MKKKINFFEVFSVFVILFIAMAMLFGILHNAEWILGDNYVFITTTAIGRFFPFVNIATMGAGRFCPLAFQDFNILPVLHLSSSLSHYIFVALSFSFFYAFYLLFAFNSFKQSRTNPLAAVALSSVLLAVNSSCPEIFLNLIYPERQAVLLFAAFAFFYSNAVKAEHEGNSYKTNFLYTAALLCAVYAAYVKETVSAALSAFALISLFCNKEISRKEKSLHFIIILNSVLFFALWYFLSWKTKTDVYRTDALIPLGTLLKTVLLHNKMLLAILVAAIVRVIVLIRSKSRPERIFDPMLAAASVFILEYICLGYSSPYYYLPAYVLGIVPVIYFIVNAEEKGLMRMFKLSAILLLLMIPAFECHAAYTLMRNAAIERQKVMPGLRLAADHYSEGGTLYLYQPMDKDKKIYDLIEMYVDYILRYERGIVGDDGRPLLVWTDNVPSMGDSDVFFYNVFHDNQFNADGLIVEQLNMQGFQFCQFQTGCLVFTKGKCGLIY